jgi:uncharacterized protein with von Willebrand factor type A (vWA) domain
MFTDFFYLMRARGLDVSPGEWLTLESALDKGLANNGLSAFYHLCRCVLVSDESQYDTFDLAFYEYFKGVETPEDLPARFLEWLRNPKPAKDFSDAEYEAFVADLDQLMRMFEERKKEQTERHDGGTWWIGTGGASPFGNAGANAVRRELVIKAGGDDPAGSDPAEGGDGDAIGGAVRTAGERHYRDFRQDKQLDIRTFQTAFRRLRQLSARVDAAKTELDIGETVKETSENAGRLSLVFEKPRKNTVKLLILIDSGGSMYPFTRLTGRLFAAVSAANHFKDLKFYYFHNCVYKKLYTTPELKRGEWIDTDQALRNAGADYKVIFVGDASMATYELMQKEGAGFFGTPNELSGYEWLARFKRHFKRLVWLNPMPEARWEKARGAQTIKLVAERIPMYPLTIDGLEAAIKALLAVRN